MKKNILLVFFSTILVILSACASDSDSSQNSSEEVKDDAILELDLATIYNSASPDVAGAERFAEIVTEKSDGKIKVNVFPDGTLGSEKDNFTELSNGDLDFILGGSAGLEMFAPEYMFFLTPFLIKDSDHLNAWFESDLHTQMTEKMKDNNVYFLGDVVRGARHTTANKEIKTPDDLEGLQIRLPETPTLVKVFSEFGSQPVSIALPELYSSLQTGVVAASEGPYEQIATNHLYEVQDYIIKTSHIYDVTSLWINSDLYESLSTEEQKIIEEAGIEATEYASELAAEKEEEYLNELIENGMEYIELSDEELEKFTIQAEPVLQKLFEENFTVISYEEFMNLGN